MRSLVLRDYQIPAYNYINEIDKTVLAICPNGGKTEITIAVIEHYLKLHPNNRVLVITHNTNVLKSNFLDRLNFLDISFSYSGNFNDNVQVHVGLPNKRKISGEYQFVVVDEAHENYLAPNVQGIIKNVSPLKQLLLTGTPSKFIKEGGYNIFAIAANEISDEWFAKLNIELVASNYNWVGRYNNENEVEKEFKFTHEDTEKTLDSVLEKIIERLQTKWSAEQFNNPSLLTKIKKIGKNWGLLYQSIGKTLITCRSIAQAEDVYNILKSHNVDVILSHSENDVESVNVNLFKEDNYDVLVVVNRARLGYSDNNLMNIIDLSGTHNPDIIYQMFCRVVRGTPDIEKYYLKVTPNELHNMSLTHLSVCAALMLTDKKYLMEYNGKNFNNIQLPVLRQPKKTIQQKTNRGGSKSYTLNLLPEFTHDIIDVFKNILHNLDSPASIYKITTLQRVKERLGHSIKKSPITEEIMYESLVDYMAL